MTRFSLVLLSFFLASLTFRSATVRADDSIYIDVGQASVKKSLLAFPSLKYLGTQASNAQHIRAGVDVFQVISNDLAVSNLFTTIAPSAFLEDPDKTGLKPAPGEPNGFKFENWKTVGADFLIRGGYHIVGNEFDLEIYVYHVPMARVVLAKEYKSPMDSLRRMAHIFSNDLIQALTGKPGMYLTKIVASREENVGSKQAYKEIYVLDWDGANQQPITAARTISLSPSWSNAGDKVAYTSFAYHTKAQIRNADLFIYDLIDKKRYLVSYRKGVNSGSVWLPGDKELLLTLTKDGNADIYRMGIDGVDVKPLTHGPNSALNVEPAISPDGKKIAFSSDRSGRPMIYTMNIDGSGAKRLTFAGVYNSTPAWSPDGKTLAFAILDTNHFDVFTLNADGTGLKRLTDARKPNGRPANNESPSWSPDGTHIVFVSDRTDRRQLYVVNADGTNERRITGDHYNWDRPKWGPFIK